MIETPHDLRGKEYYDTVYSTSNPSYDCPPEKSQYYLLWKKMLELSGRRIVDVGCGVGQVAQLAISMGKEYMCGIDFSPVAIAYARRRCPTANFLCNEVEVCYGIGSDAYDTLLMAETLEHVADDIGFLSGLAVGTHIVLSLPTFTSLGHARYFKDAEDVRDRYSSLIDIEEIGMIYVWVYLSGHIKGGTA